MEVIRRHRKVFIIMKAVSLFLTGWLIGEIFRAVKPIISAPNPDFSWTNISNPVMLTIVLILFLVFYNIYVEEPLRIRIDALVYAYNDIIELPDMTESLVIDDPFKSMKPVAKYTKTPDGRIRFRWC